VVLVPGEGDELEGFLHGLGATPEQVRAAAEAGHLHGLAADLVLAFGDVVTRHGDYYGPVVNLASRLSDEAIPGEVLVDGAVAEAVVVDGLEFEPAGRRLLKGFSDPVRVSTLVDRR
jgi:class 3 adenylate cyclase